MSRRLLQVLAIALALAVPGDASASTSPLAASGHRIFGYVPDTGTAAHLAARIGKSHHALRARVAASRGVRARVADTLPYHGGPVLHSNRTHLIFWQPSGSGLAFEPGYVSLLEGFMQNVEADSHLPGNVYALSGQYFDSAGPAAYDSTYGGAVIDGDPLPPNGCTLPPPPALGNTGPGWSDCVTDSQLEAEIEQVVTANNLPRTDKDIYFMVTPSGLGSCTPNASGSEAGPDSCSLGGPGPNPSSPYQGSYCGYHSQTNSGLIYAVIPYNAVSGHCQSENPRPNQNPADPTISTLSHEHNETVTDPLGNAWITNDGAEEADLCALYFGANVGGSGASAFNEVIGTGHYYLQEEWSDQSGTTADTACQARAQPDEIAVHVPGRVPGDRPIGLSGSAHGPNGSILEYSWFFGDGARGSKPATTHAYLRAGSYTVVLASVDAEQLFAFAKAHVTVVRPPAPVVRLTAGPAHALSDSPRPRFRFVSDAAVASFTCQIDAGRRNPCRSPFTSPRLAPGRHTLRITARDTFAQASRRPAAETFTVR